MRYRKEIDGLRTIAVLPVILFHAGILGFGGGYVGVDIFFVISGHLITSIILEEQNQGRFSIINFYERRARRILPALIWVLMLTSIASFALMSPGELEDYSNSLISVVTFSSNIFFYLQSGYFSMASDEKPLLHTWSLAVEEQYYIVFPVLISSLWFMGKKKLTILIATAALISLSFAQYLADTGRANFNFYLIFSRGWELLFGSLIALLSLPEKDIKNRWREILGFTGLALIVYAIVFFDQSTPFPSVYGLIPVLGTCLVIIAANATSLVGRFLSHKFLVYIGLLSYSLYLWHQPILAFIRLKTIGEPSTLVLFAAILATFIAAYISYIFIEKPLKNKQRFPRRFIFQSSLIAIIAATSVGFAGSLSGGFPSRFDQHINLESIQSSQLREKCHTKGLDYLKPEKACRYFGHDVEWATFGDSHMVETTLALANILEPSGQGVLHLSFSGCPPALYFDTGKLGCSDWINESLEYLKNEQSIKKVLVGFRYSSFLFGGQTNDYPNLPNETPTMEYTELAKKDGKVANPREVYWDSLSAIIEQLLSAGKQVYLLYPIPELPAHINKLATPFSIFNKEPLVNLQETTSHNYYSERNAYILEKLDSLPQHANLIAIKPFDALCSSNHCPAAIDGQALYFDDNHLSLIGAKRLLEMSSIIRQ